MILRVVVPVIVTVVALVVVLLVEVLFSSVTAFTAVGAVSIAVEHACTVKLAEPYSKGLPGPSELVTLSVSGPEEEADMPDCRLWGC